MKSKYCLFGSRQGVNIIVEKLVSIAFTILTVILLFVIGVMIFSFLDEDNEEKRAAENFMSLSVHMSALIDAAVENPGQFVFRDLPFELPEDYIIVGFDSGWNHVNQQIQLSRNAPTRALPKLKPSDVYSYNGYAMVDESGADKDHRSYSHIDNKGPMLLPRKCLHKACLCLYHENIHEAGQVSFKDSGSSDRHVKDCIVFHSLVKFSSILGVQGNRGTVRPNFDRPNLDEFSRGNLREYFDVPYTYLITYGTHELVGDTDQSGVTGIQLQAVQPVGDGNGTVEIIMSAPDAYSTQRRLGSLQCPDGTVPEAYRPCIDKFHQEIIEGDVPKLCLLDEELEYCIVDDVYSCTSSASPIAVISKPCTCGGVVRQEGVCVLENNVQHHVSCFVNHKGQRMQRNVATDVAYLEVLEELWLPRWVTDPRPVYDACDSACETYGTGEIDFGLEVVSEQTPYHVCSFTGSEVCGMLREACGGSCGIKSSFNKGEICATAR